MNDSTSRASERMIAVPGRADSPSIGSEKLDGLITTWRTNPLHYFTQEETRTLFGIGEKAFRTLTQMPGCPMVAKKINPDHFKAWLWEMRSQIGKLCD